MKKRITVAVKSFLTMMLLFSLVIVFPESVNAAFFGVDSWEDCILENLDGAKNDFAIRALVEACEGKPKVKEIEDERRLRSRTTPEDCYLENAKFAHSRQSARALGDVCRNLYGEYGSKPFKKPGFFDPKNYRDCYLEYSKDIAEEINIRSVAAMCLAKFPK